jgi:hypothetical protein
MFMVNVIFHSLAALSIVMSLSIVPLTNTATLNMMTPGITTLKKTMPTITTLSIMALSVKTPSIMTLNSMILSTGRLCKMTFTMNMHSLQSGNFLTAMFGCCDDQNNDTQHNDIETLSISTLKHGS